MKIGLLIYGSLDTLSGGYYYDRRLVTSLQACGDQVQLLSIPWRNYPSALADNLSFRLPAHLDILIQDELCHPSLLAANQLPHPYPVVSLVHHLRSSEQRPGWQNVFFRFIERAYLRQLDGFIFNSKTTAQVVHSLVGAYQPSIVAYPPTDRFNAGLSEAVVTARALQPGPLRLIFVGNVIRRKGLSTLITAISHLPANSVSLEVVGSLAADPGYASQVRQQAVETGLQASIRFHGILEDAILRQELEAAQLLVVPSSYEGFGIVYLEGMAFGLPAIATSSGAAIEVIRPAENGYLIRPDDAVTLSRRLLDLNLDRHLLQQLSLNAMLSWRQSLPWEQSVAGIRNFLARLVA